MKRRDGFQLMISALALACVVAFNNCSGADIKSADNRANATVIALPDLPTSAQADEKPEISEKIKP